MMAPRFWSNPPERPGWQARALAPAALVWRAGAGLRGLAARPRHAGVPVLCIDSLTGGGSGKTPMVAALMQRLAMQGRAAHVVSRGRGSVLRGPTRVDSERHKARDVGDEALMLSASGTVWASHDPRAGVRAAIAEGAGIVLLDGGLRDPHLIPDHRIVMVDAARGFGNGRLLPAGPLRAPAPAGLGHADLVVLTGTPAMRRAALARWPALRDAALLEAELHPMVAGLPLAGEDIVAFSGIARPEAFFVMLRAMGARLVATHPFPAHHDYRARLLRRLLGEARGVGAMLVTTEKDAVRLPGWMRPEVVTVLVRLEPQDWAPLDAMLAAPARQGRETP